MKVRITPTARKPETKNYCSRDPQMSRNLARAITLTLLPIIPALTDYIEKVKADPMRRDYDILIVANTIDGEYYGESSVPYKIIEEWEKRTHPYDDHTNPKPSIHVMRTDEFKQYMKAPHHVKYLVLIGLHKSPEGQGELVKKIVSEREIMMKSVLDDNGKIKYCAVTKENGRIGSVMYDRALVFGGETRAETYLTAKWDGPDNDTIPIKEEVVWMADPTMLDTDHDLLDEGGRMKGWGGTDFEEVRIYHTDPSKDEGWGNPEFKDFDKLAKLLGGRDATPEEKAVKVVAWRGIHMRYEESMFVDMGGKTGKDVFLERRDPDYSILWEDCSGWRVIATSILIRNDVKAYNASVRPPDYPRTPGHAITVFHNGEGWLVLKSSSKQLIDCMRPPDELPKFETYIYKCKKHIFGPPQPTIKDILKLYRDRHFKNYTWYVVYNEDLTRVIEKGTL